MNIKVRDLRKSFARKSQHPLVVLDGVNIDIEHGEFTTLIGPTGCGKTTILKIIAGIEEADGGKIESEPPLLGTVIPIVWQEHRLFPWRTVLRNVSFPLELRDVEPAKAENISHSLLELMGLDDFENYYPWQLSGGMEQRIAIARALTADSKCLLMDEPFASVDYLTKQSLFQQVQELRKRRELTVVYVTHDLRDAIQFSDSVVVLSSRPARVREVIRPTSSDAPYLEEQLRKMLL